MLICFVFLHNTTAVNVALVTVSREVLIELTQIFPVLPSSKTLSYYSEHSRRVVGTEACTTLIDF